jgi:hypothetical protein
MQLFLIIAGVILLLFIADQIVRNREEDLDDEDYVDVDF